MFSMWKDLNMPDFGFSTVPGNNAAKNYFLNLLKSENIPQSIIITGEEGLGKLRIAEQFVMALLCEKRNEDGACGKCNSCLSYIQRQNPNAAYWYPKGQNTTIDQMRSLKEMSAYTPAKGKYKINIIEKGDTLNEEASNSILKIIEEPPKYLINILLYSNPHNILQTIKSRSIAVNLNPVSKDLIKDYIMKHYDISEDYGEFVSLFSMGSVGRAKMFLENEKRDIFRQLIFDAAKSILTDPMDILYIADRLGDRNFYFSETGKEKAEDIKNSPKNYFLYAVECEYTQSQCVFFALDMLSLVLRDMLAVICGAENETVNRDRLDEIKKLAEKTAKEKIIKSIRIIWQTKDKLRANINTSIALQSMLCRMLTEMKLSK